MQETSTTLDKMESALSEILSEPVSQVKVREQSHLDYLLDQRGGRCVLFGAGNLGRQSLLALRGMGVEPLAFSDNNLNAWGQATENVPVLPPQEAAERYGADAHFFIAIRNERHWYKETADQLSGLGCRNISSTAPIAWKFPSEFPPFLLYDRLPHKLYEEADDVLRASKIWEDDASRGEYLAQVRLRALGDPSGLSKPASDESYFLDDVFNLGSEDVFIDCGAFDGDTIRSLIDERRQFGRIEAIEADSRSFRCLTDYVKGLPPGVRNRIRLHRCAIGSQPGTVRFDGSGTADSKLSDRGAMLVDMLSLDILYSTTPVAMIKMDIEGGEFDALLGARQIIRRDRPILAICVYHTQRDLWRLPLLMRELCRDYRMYLRCYRGDGIQTVAFAVPPERSLWK